MSAKTKQRAFIVMPFGKKKAAKGPEIDFDRVYAELIRPAVEAADLIAHRADAERRAGSIHADMFQELLLAELVVADLTIDNPNVWYELGVRDALRSSGSVMLYAQRDRLPFDVAGQRMQRYTLTGGAPDAARMEAERAALTACSRPRWPTGRGVVRVRSTPSCRISRSRAGKASSSARSTSSGRGWRSGRNGYGSHGAASGPPTSWCLRTTRPTACSSSRPCVPRPKRWSASTATTSRSVSCSARQS